MPEQKKEIDQCEVCDAHGVPLITCEYCFAVTCVMCPCLCEGCA